jgi:hypothetical protein
MTKKRNTQTIPFSMRLTFEERANLKARAGDKSLAIFIRSQLFDENEVKNRKEKVRGRTLCAQILSALGKSEISKNLHILSDATKSGSLVVTPETQELIDSTLNAIYEMRSTLLEELGVQSGSDQ